MDTVKRITFPDGSIREEIHYRGSTPHGPWRRWHPNGVLAEESWFVHGLYATSVTRTWDERGTLRSEVPFVNGRQVGRLTVYGSDGSILVRKYLLEDGEATMSEYAAACKSRPELPRYSELSEVPDKRTRVKGAKPRPSLSQSSGRRTMPSNAELEREDSSIREFAKHVWGEAIDWLDALPSGSCRTLGEFGPRASVEFVSLLYDLGAEQVLVVGDPSDRGSSFDQSSTNHLLVKLPAASSLRKKLFDFEMEHSHELGFDAQPDVGQRFLYLLLC